MKFLLIITLTVCLMSQSIQANDTIPSLGNDTTICLGDYMVLSAFVPLSCNANYLWSDGSELPEKIITKSGTYWIEVQSSCVSFRDTIQIDFISCHPGCASSTSIAGIYSSSEADIRGKTLVATIEKDGFYVAGTKDDSVFIVKVDLAGSILWTKTFEIVPGGRHYVNGITIDQNGILAIAGTFNLFFSGTSTSFIFLFDPKVNQILWAKEYSVEYYSTCLSMIYNPTNGNYLLSHETSDPFGGISGGSILEINKNTGDIVRIIAKDKTILHDFVVHGDFIYGAGGHQIGLKNYRQSLIKLRASDGTIEWVKAGEHYNTQAGNVYAPDLLISHNEIYSIFSDINNELHIQKTSLEGNLIWLKRYDIPGRLVYANEIIPSENGFIIYAQIFDTQELLLFKIDTEGNVLWASAYYTLTNFFSTQAADAVNQVIEVANQLVFTSFSIDSVDAFSPYYPNMIIGRTTLSGNIISSCVNQRNIYIQEHNVLNPTFLSVSPGDLNFEAQIHSFTPAINESTIISRESCISYDTIFNYYSASICDGGFFEGYGVPGIYSDTFLTSSGCDSIRVLALTFQEDINTTITKTICSGTTFEGYSTSGVYTDTFNISFGCDSIRELHLKVISCMPIVYYDLEACKAVMSEGTNMDYTEFTPAYPNLLTCSDVSANYAYRSPPQKNKHSCTPGVAGSVAMCISSYNSCVFSPGHQASLVIEVMINPHSDSIVRITGLEFYEKAPVNYNWINGNSGPNNYPTRYGIRILKNDLEIFRDDDIQTGNDWRLESFDFMGIQEFEVEENTMFRIELLPYCPVGNGADVSAWDVDEIKIFGGCVPVEEIKPVIEGAFFTNQDKPITDVEVRLANNSLFSGMDTRKTDETGYYIFDDLELEESCFLKGYKNDNALNGVSTLDLIHILKHLLGKEPFTSLDQFIAADANNDGIVSALDLLEIRKLILGIYSEFPHNTSWRFGPLPQDMSGSNISLFRDMSSIEYLDKDTQIVDFIGIKIGDLNGSVSSQMKSQDIQYRNDDKFDLIMSDKEIKSGIPFSIEYIALANIDISGMQFALNIRDMEFITLTGNSAPVTSECYFLKDGILRFSLSSEELIRISNNDILFSLVLKSQEDGFLSDRISLDENNLKPEVYLKDLDILKLNLSINKPIKNNPISSFLQVKPNPSYSNVIIHFNIPEAGPVEIRFIDLSGRVLYAIHKRYASGEYIEEITRDDFVFPTGIVYCQLITNGFIKTVKFINLN